MLFARLLWGALLATGSVCATAQSYLFTFDPANTWTDGTVRIRMFSRGTFKGNFGESGWPYQTQTKLGAGVFGALDNDPIPAQPFLELGHAAYLRTSGTFKMSVDTAGLKATVFEYEAERKADGSINLSTTIALNNEPFRTKNPTGTFGDHLPPMRMGTLHIDKFLVTQKPGGRTASIVPLGGGLYGVAVSFMTTIRFTIQEFGGIPLAFDAPASLVGLLRLSGGTATFGHPTGRGGDNISRNVEMPVSPFFFTVLDGPLPPPILKVTTTVHRIDLRINGARRTHANGVRL